MAEQAMLDETRCIDLNVSHACDAACRFCSQDPEGREARSMTLEQACRHVFAGFKQGYRRLAFSGGEPTLLPFLEELLRFARKTGFESIRLQTNGLRLAEAGYSRRLMDAGLTTVRFSLHGPDASVHDRLMGVPGAFARALGAVRVLRGLGCRLGANLVLNRENVETLPEYARFFVEEAEVTSQTWIYPLHSGRMAREAERLGVPMPEAASWVRKALGVFERHGLELPTLLHFTPCVLPGYEDRMAGWHRFNALVVEPDGSARDIDLSVARQKALLPACAACAYRARCPGVEREALRLHGPKGFDPLPRRVPSKVRAPSPDPGRRILTENERCVLALLERGGPLTTGELLREARRFPLCQDCRGGPAVLMAAEWLLKMGRLRRQRTGGRYLWMKAPEREPLAAAP